ncbi:sulfurtransferase, partial [Halalkalibacter wakoensis]|uniref:sulfurtransferase n=1 Tax=Halalkalibacter wakoensis TaxID=127891 RepID=UPI00054EC09D
MDKEHPVEGYLVSKQTFEQKMNQLGIKDQDTVVVYDEGDDTRATRLFYALEYYGHQNVRLLNGGYKAWQANEGKISKDIHSPKRGNFTARENDRLMVTKDEVKNVIGEKDIVIFDVDHL